MLFFCVDHNFFYHSTCVFSDRRFLFNDVINWVQLLDMFDKEVMKEEWKMNLVASRTTGQELSSSEQG